MNDSTGAPLWVRTSAYSVAWDDWHVARVVVHGVDAFMLWDGKRIAGKFDTASQAKTEAERMANERKGK